MKLSLRGEYAIRALVELAEDYSSEVVPIHVISTHQDVPKRFLEQILNDLKSAGFVESKRGIAGGYRLARPPQEISLAAIVAHVEGVPVPENNANAPRLHPGASAVQKAVDDALKKAQEAMTDVLKSMSLADLRDQARHWRNESAAVSDYTI